MNGAVRRRVGWRAWVVEAGWSNWAYLALILALAVFVLLRQPDGAPAAPGVGFAITLSGFASLVMILANAARLASAMARSRPLLSPSLGLGLPLLCNLVLMELAMGRIVRPET